MQVDAIGTRLGSNSAIDQSQQLNQEEFIKLFLAQLNFQDPSDPLDTQEFLAQMAQFAALNQAQQQSQSLDSLLYMSSVSQASNLLGKTVNFVSQSGTGSGDVTAVDFARGVPLLTINSNGQPLTDIPLSQISTVIELSNDNNENSDEDE